MQPKEAQHNQAESGFWLTNQLKTGFTKRNLFKAVKDIRSGWARRALWSTMGMQDIKHRYRRSVIGPFWLTLSMGVMVAALGLLYGAIFGRELEHYLPYLAAGFVCWGLISTLILDGTNAFIASEGMIKQLAAPLSVHVYAVVRRTLLIFFHNVWIYLAVAIWFGKMPGFAILLAIPAVAIFLFNGVAAGLTQYAVSRYSRDRCQCRTGYVFSNPCDFEAEDASRASVYTGSQSILLPGRTSPRPAPRAVCIPAGHVGNSGHHNWRLVDGADILYDLSLAIGILGVGNKTWPLSNSTMYRSCFHSMTRAVARSKSESLAAVQGAESA
jgi:hypothetical protein